jgi:DNA-binding NarL/FixJ family response regulator
VDELFTGIHTVASGEALLSPGATRSLITRFLTTRTPCDHRVPPQRLAHLTARERESWLWPPRGSPTTRSPTCV